jgi:hypothetical protein
MTREAPAVAKWLLRHFGCSPNNEAILGDLDECYRQGHSYLWYWKQTVKSVAAGLWVEVCMHKWLALRAVIAGWISCSFLILPLIEGYVSVFLKNETFSGYNPRNWWTLSGSVIQYYDWWFVLIAPFGVGIIGGWLVAHTHRQFQRPMVLAFLASRCAIVLPMACFLLIGMFVEPQYVEGFVKLALGNIFTLPGILVGSLSITQRRGEQKTIAT